MGVSKGWIGNFQGLERIQKHNYCEAKVAL